MALIMARRVAVACLIALIVLSTARGSRAAGWKTSPAPPPPPLTFWEEVAGALSALLGVPQEKSGSSLDPNGSASSGAGSPSTPGAAMESGSSLDPNGKS
jgi:hypothetical protein